MQTKPNNESEYFFCVQRGNPGTLAAGCTHKNILTKTLCRASIGEQKCAFWQLQHSDHHAMKHASSWSQIRKTYDARPQQALGQPSLENQILGWVLPLGHQTLGWEHPLGHHNQNWGRQHQLEHQSPQLGGLGCTVLAGWLEPLGQAGPA
mmetsp:Transcript_70729/g.118262  ORF Transcript_70729/g.118262 Transcript_70729/m.118262 type:complete len:150 (-) Transcript_70729:348-797(-)